MHSAVYPGLLLPDIRRWAQVAAHFVKPGGIFYITELHPVALALDDESSDLRLRYPYFEHVEPLGFDVQGSYADPTAKVEHDKEYRWSHGLGEIVSALAEAGLRIEVVREFPWCDSKMIAMLERRDDGSGHRCRERRRRRRGHRCRERRGDGSGHRCRDGWHWRHRPPCGLEPRHDGDGDWVRWGSSDCSSGGD